MGLLRLKRTIVRSCHDRHEEDDEEQARLGQVDMGIVYVGYDDDDIQGLLVVVLNYKMGIHG